MSVLASESWESCPDEDVGWCLLYGGQILSEEDLRGIDQGFGTRIKPTGGPPPALY
jgi:hypothetical protein